MFLRRVVAPAKIIFPKAEEDLTLRYQDLLLNIFYLFI